MRVWNMVELFPGVARGVADLRRGGRPWTLLAVILAQVGRLQAGPRGV